MDKNNSKFCRSCHTLKYFIEFNKDKCKHDGMASKCKNCIEVKNKNYYWEKRNNQLNSMLDKAVQENDEKKKLKYIKLLEKHQQKILQTPIII